LRLLDRGFNLCLKREQEVISERIRNTYLSRSTLFFLVGRLGGLAIWLFRVCNGTLLGRLFESVTSG